MMNQRIKHDWLRRICLWIWTLPLGCWSLSLALALEQESVEPTSTSFRMATVSVLYAIWVALVPSIIYYGVLLAAHSRRVLGSGIGFSAVIAAACSWFCGWQVGVTAGLTAVALFSYAAATAEIAGELAGWTGRRKCFYGVMLSASTVSIVAILSGIAFAVSAIDSHNRNRLMAGDMLPWTIGGILVWAACAIVVIRTSLIGRGLQRQLSIASAAEGKEEEASSKL